ncbi:Hydroxyacyl-thioester dehydratase type mitochondrial [Chlorella sorokiniana]|uniref:Hydroxyacyl-thioester dehydratase type mitochondrial n=1 Tax=Chlorella sorokiniana TaxID=3076 RepID=A0A2P6U4F6_CHLSO|nr:Hydroxyacyl-thioester dehydratase type mitochondrial [Chlorella sorokiniana]|eukprot:PRW61191.1 Hydroxyacyl-thioester dehydratase type mitochondrial [Chlorella sorokiniana]
MDARKLQLEQELGDCVLNSSWFFCVAGVALAVPLGVKKKSYWPVVYLGLAGTLLDLINGLDKCKTQRQALESYLRSTEALGQQGTSLPHTLADRQQQHGGSQGEQGG